MKMNNKIIVKLVAIALLSGMIVTFTHCVPQGAKEVGDGGSFKNTKQTISTPTKPKDEGQIINEIQVTTGIKNHEQILHTMGVVTGIDPYAVNDIMNVYNQVSSSMPTDNDIKVYTSTQQVAVSKLAAEFCFKLSETGFAAQRLQIWRLNLASASNTALSVQGRDDLIEDTIQGLWGGMISDEERNMVQVEFNNLIDAAIDGTNSTANTQRAFRAVCTAALSSAYITLL
jgi:hypothetical protein